MLAEAYPERSRSEWGDFVKLGYVTVNDAPCTKAATVKESTPSSSSCPRPPS